MASANNNIPTLASSESNCGLSSIDVSVNCNNTYNLATRGYVWAVVSSVSGNFGTVKSINGVRPDENNNVSLPTISSLDYSGKLNQINADLSVTIGGEGGHRLLTDLDGGNSFIGEFADWSDVKSSAESLSSASNGNFIVVNNSSDYTSEKYMTQVHVEYTNEGDIIEHLYVGQILYNDITLESEGISLPKGHTLTLDDVKSIGRSGIEWLPLYDRHYGKWYLTYAVRGEYDVENWCWIYQINDDYRQDVKIAVNATENAANLADLIDSGNPAKRTYKDGDGRVTVDLTLSENSTNPVANAAITKAVRKCYTKDDVDELLKNKQGTLTFDSVPTQGSVNPVKSSGIFSAFETMGASKINKVESAVEGNIPKFDKNGMLTDSGETFDDYQKVMESLTYSELKERRDAGKLVPGASYRITDYVAVTNGNSKSRSAEHSFDIIVVADSPNALNEVARAAIHDGNLPDDIVDGDVRRKYFEGCKLSAWKVWYCMDNDRNRFDWAKSSCKGIVYRLIDEFGNDCPYDFKGLQFLAFGEGSGIYRYTFDSGSEIENIDLSLNGFNNSIFGNHINFYFTQTYKQKLNCIVFKGAKCNNNTFENGCENNTFGSNCNSNTFGSNCNNNTLGDGCYSNTLGNGCYSNTLGSFCYNNTFRNGCYSNTLGNGCYSNTLGNRCVSNRFGSICYNNTFGNGCYINTLGNRCVSNTFENGCFNNTFGLKYLSNTFGQDCSSIVFLNDAGNNQDFVSYVIIESGNKNIEFHLTGNITEPSPYRNVTVKAGVNNSDAVKQIYDDTDGGQTINTVFKPANSKEICI